MFIFKEWFLWVCFMAGMRQFQSTAAVASLQVMGTVDVNSSSLSPS